MSCLLEGALALEQKDPELRAGTLPAQWVRSENCAYQASDGQANTCQLLALLLLAQGPRKTFHGTLFL